MKSKAKSKNRRRSARSLAYRRSLIVSLLSSAMTLQSAWVGRAQEPSVVPDGRTATNVSTLGTTTTITTETLRNSNAYNSFSRFNVPSGTTTNLVVPDSASNLINLVTDERTEINGILNSYQNDKIGGNVYFLNPNGILIGESGVVNVGSLHLQTPTNEFVYNTLSALDAPSYLPQYETQIFEGTFPLSENGLVTVNGKVNAVDKLEIVAKNVDVQKGAVLRAERTAVLDPASIVNVGDASSWGSRLEETPDGKIRIVGDSGATDETPSAQTSKKNEEKVYGDVKIYADDDLKVAGEITGKDVSLTSDDRDVDVSGTITANTLEIAADENISLNDATIALNVDGSSENVAKLTADDIYLTDSSIVASMATGVDTTSISDGETAPRILLDATHKAKIVNSEIDGGKVVDVVVQAIKNSRFEVLAWGAVSDVEISVDEDSTITGNNIVLQSGVTGGIWLDVDENGFLVNDAGEVISEEDRLALGQESESIAEDLINFFSETLPELVGSVEVPLLPSVKAFDVDSLITVSGDLTAENDLVVESTSAISSRAYSLGLVGLGFNLAVTISDSTIRLGDAADLTSNNGNISIESIVQNEVSQTSFNGIPANFMPIDFIANVAVMLGDNRIVIDDGVDLTAKKGSVFVDALTERAYSSSATGGRGNSYYAFAGGFVYEDFNTRVDSGANVDAQNLKVTAYTDVLDNGLTSSVVLGDGWVGGASSTFDKFTGVITGIKKGFFSLAEALSGKTFGNPDSLRGFGLGTAFSLMIDDVDTVANITGGVINVSNDVKVSATTKNVPVAVAMSVSNKFLLNDNDAALAQKENAGNVSLPIVVSMQNTTANIESGTTIYAGNDVSVLAETTNPYNTDQWLAGLIAGTKDLSDAAIDFVTQQLCSNNFGIPRGLFNTWSQTSTDSEETAVGVMLSAMYVRNDATAKIEDGVTIGAYNGSRPDLTVSATTDVYYGHVTGNMRSFLKTFPNFKYPNVASATGYSTKAKEAMGTMIQSMWGNEGSKGVGAGIALDVIDSSAVAEIGAANLTVDDLTVSAATSGFDLNLAVGASQTDSYGVNGSVLTTIATIDSKARVAEETLVDATGDVDIDASDSTWLVNASGNLVVTDAAGFGVSASIPVVVRDVKAVWGLWNPETSTSNGDDLYVSTVGGNVSVSAESLGAIVSIATAGAISEQKRTASLEAQKASSIDEKMPEMRDLLRQVEDEAREAGVPNNDVAARANNANTQSSLGFSGVLVVNVIVDDVYAGINGDVQIAANGFSVSAAEEAVEVAVAGGLALELGGRTSTGIAGSIAANLVLGDSRAVVDLNGGKPGEATTSEASDERPKLVYAENFDVDASNGGYVGAFSAGAAGSTASQGVQVAGSLSLATVKGETLAEIYDATIERSTTSTDSGNLSTTATNQAVVANFAGGVAIGRSNSVGIAVAGNTISLDTRAVVANSTIDANNMLARAKSESLIVGVALGGSVGLGTAGVGGTISFAMSDGDTCVSIDGSNLSLAGTLSASASSDAPGGNDTTYADLVAALIESEKNEGEEASDKTDFLSDGEKIEYDETSIVGAGDEYSTETTTQTKDVELALAMRCPRIVTAALTVGGGGKVGVGLNAGLNLLTEETFVDVSNSTISTSSAGLSAYDGGGAIAVGLGVAGAGKVGVSGDFAVNLVGGRTEVNLNESTLKTTAGDAILTAENAAGIFNVSTALSGGGTAGVGVAFSYNSLARSTAVGLYDSTLTSAGNVVMKAENSGDIVGALLSVGGGGKAGAGASVSINSLGSFFFDDAELDDAQDVKDAARQKRDETDELFAYVDANPAEALWNAEYQTAIRVVDSTIDAGGDVAQSAAATGGIVSVAVGAGFGGTAGIGVAGALNLVGGSVGIQGDGATIEAGNDQVSSAQISNEIVSVVLGGAFGATGGGVGVSLGADLLRGTGEVDYRGKSTLTSGRDLVLKATSGATIANASSAFAGGKYVGVATALAANVVDGTTNVALDGATLTAGDSIVLDAETKNELISVGVAAAASYITDPTSLFTASIGASIAYNNVEGDATVKANASDLTAFGNVLLNARENNELTAVAGAASVAVSVGAAVSPNVGYNGVSGAATIDVDRTMIDALARSSRKLSDLASVYSVDVRDSDSLASKGLALDASNRTSEKLFYFVFSATGAAAISIGVSADDVSGESTIDVQNSSFNSRWQDVESTTFGYTASDSQDVALRAGNETETFSVVSSTSGAILGLGATVDLAFLDSTASVSVIKSDIYAKRKLDVLAMNDEKNERGMAGVAVGGLAIPANALGMTTDSTAKTTIDSSSLVAGSDLSVLSQNKSDAFLLNVSLGAGVVSAGVAAVVDVREQEALVDVKGESTLKSGAKLAIEAENENDYTAKVHSLGAGAAEISGGLQVVSDKSVAQVVFEADSDNLTKTPSLSGANVSIAANETYRQTDTTVGGYAVGGLGAAGGLNVVVIDDASSVSGVVQIESTNDANVTATTTRELSTTVLGGLEGGLGGVVGAGSFVEFGSASGYIAPTATTRDVLNDLTNDGDENAVATEQNDAELAAFLAKYSALEESGPADVSAKVRLSGDLTVGGDASLTASVVNDVDTTASGIGVAGGVAIGGARDDAFVEDVVDAYFSGSATAEGDFALKGVSRSSWTGSALAGGGAFLGSAAGASTDWEFDGDVQTTLDSDSSVVAKSVSIEAVSDYSDMSATTDSGSVALVGGLGGSLNKTKLDGDANVTIAKSATVYAPTINVAARKSYDDVALDVYGLAGGLLGGAGINSDLTLLGAATTTVGDDVKLWSSKDGIASLYEDSAAIEASISTESVVLKGEVDSGGLAIAPFGDADVTTDFDASVVLGTANVCSSSVSALAFQELDASALLTSLAGGLVATAGGSSMIDSDGSSRVEANGTTLSALEDLIVKAGDGASTLDAQTRVFNYTLAPITTDSMTSADVDVDWNDAIELTDVDFQSARDVVLSTGNETQNFYAFDKLINTYSNKDDSDFVVNGEFSTTEISGTVEANVAGKLLFGGNDNLTAGSRSRVEFSFDEDTNGNLKIQAPNWISFNLKESTQNPYYSLQAQIAELEEKKKTASNVNDAFAVAAYQVEIDALKAQLADYLVSPNADPNLPSSYVVVSALELSDAELFASAGSVLLNATSVEATASGNKIVANSAPTIAITNNSSRFLNIADSTILIPNPIDGGGRISLNGDVLTEEKARTQGLTEDAFALSFIGDATATAPSVKIANTYRALGTRDLSTELTLDGTQISNPGGSTELSSVGSVWLANGSSIDSRDVAITTGGSFFQGYQSGMVNTGGSPLASGSSVSKSIYEWMNSTTLFSGKLDAVMSAYDDAVEALQNASTADSWNKAFGANGSNSTKDLVAKTQGASLSTEIAAYNSAKSQLESALSAAASSYIGGKIKTYGDARTTTDSLTTPSAKSQVSNASSGPTEIGTTLDAGGTITGGRSVFISAETLNVNGLIQSGMTDCDVDLRTDAVTNAIAKNPNGTIDLTSIVFNTSDSSALALLPTVIYRNGKIEVASVEARGGDVTLFGNVISTGNGSIKVADGYGGIRIFGNPNYELVLGRADAGSGSEGTIRIVDVASGTPVETVYQRVDGVYRKSVNGGDWTTSSTPFQYETAKNRWLEKVVGLDSTLTWKYTYDKDVGYVLGIPGDWMCKDDDQLDSVGGTSNLSKTTPVGTFLTVKTDLGNGTLYGAYNRTTTSPNETYVLEDTGKPEGDSLWSGHRHYYYHYTATQDVSETFTTWLNASQPIDIVFEGYETDGSSITVANDKNITFGGLARADNVYVTTRNDVLSENGGIVRANAIYMQTANVGSASNGLTVGGLPDGSSTYLEYFHSQSGGRGRFAVDGEGDLIVRLDSRPDVFDVETTGDVLLASNSLAVAASDVSIVSKTGRVGAADAETRTYDPNGYFRLQSTGNVVVDAASDVRIKQTGDLYAERIVSRYGSAEILVDGDVLDKNEVEKADPWTLEKQSEYWNDLGLIKGTEAYQTRIDRYVDAYEREMTQIYFNAWADANYDANSVDRSYRFQYSDEQRSVLAATMTAEEIAAEEDFRTELYFASFDAEYDPNYRYVASDAEKEKLTRLSGWTEAELRNELRVSGALVSRDAGTRFNTTTTVEDPNFAAGKNLKLTATGAIGAETDAVEIPRVVSIDELKGNDVWLRAIAEAERGDVDWSDPNVVSIKRYDDLDVDVQGALTATSQTGDLYLGSRSDLVVDQIEAGTNGANALRLKVDGSILPLDSTSRISARNAILEASRGTIGVSSASPLVVNLTGVGADGWIVARGKKGVYLQFVDDDGENANAYVREIGAQGDVALTAAAIVDAEPENDAAKIAGENISLTATNGSIGDALAALNVRQYAGGSLTLDAAGDVAIVSKTALDLDSAASGGNVELFSGETIRIDGVVEAAKDARFVAIDSTILGPNSSVSGENVYLISLEGNVATDAPDDESGVELNAQGLLALVAEKGTVGGVANGDSFVADFSAKRIDAIGVSDVLLRRLEEGCASFGTLASSNRTFVDSEQNDKISVERLTTASFKAPSASIGSYSNRTEIDLSQYADGSIVPETRDALSGTLVVQTSGSVMFNSTRADAALDFGEMNIDGVSSATINSDRLTIDRLFGAETGTLSVAGYSGGLAKLTDIKAVDLARSLTIDRLYSDSVSISSDSLAEGLTIVDGRVGTAANDRGLVRTAIGDLTTSVSAVDKRLGESDRARFWSVDGTYSLKTTPTGVYARSSSMLALGRFAPGIDVDPQSLANWRASNLQESERRMRSASRELVDERLKDLVYPERGQKIVDDVLSVEGFYDDDEDKNDEE